jgi:hypothetical protein
MDEAVERHAYLDFPAHIIRYSSVVDLDDDLIGYFTHSHRHVHSPPPRGPGAIHEHRHEHCWAPVSDHHHPVDPDDDVLPADHAADPALD